MSCFPLDVYIRFRVSREDLDNMKTTISLTLDGEKLETLSLKDEIFIYDFKKQFLKRESNISPTDGTELMPLEFKILKFISKSSEKYEEEMWDIDIDKDSFVEIIDCFIQLVRVRDDTLSTKFVRVDLPE